MQKLKIYFKNDGFSLVEVAIALIVIGVILGAC
ncbi:MAG: prepilin-type N-terminal cleavage/methylation domain-containing protein [Holosporaceae bacterium]|nr:MAG: prepilin-type N-terminal cleavage/methylation domain-containing protein [Holosporaceae bacterium]